MANCAWSRSWVKVNCACNWLLPVTLRSDSTGWVWLSSARASVMLVSTTHWPVNVNGLVVVAKLSLCWLCSLTVPTCQCSLPNKVLFFHSKVCVSADLSSLSKVSWRLRPLLLSSLSILSWLICHSSLLLHGNANRSLIGVSVCDKSKDMPRCDVIENAAALISLRLVTVSAEFIVDADCVVCEKFSCVRVNANGGKAILNLLAFALVEPVFDLAFNVTLGVELAPLFCCADCVWKLSWNWSRASRLILPRLNSVLLVASFLAWLLSLSPSNANWIVGCWLATLDLIGLIGAVINCQSVALSERVKLNCPLLLNLPLFQPKSCDAVSQRSVNFSGNGWSALTCQSVLNCNAVAECSISRLSRSSWVVILLPKVFSCTWGNWIRVDCVNGEGCACCGRVSG